MLDGRDGKARQKAMELLVRYAEALGAERFVDTKNVAGVPGSANPFLQNYYKDAGARATTTRSSRSSISTPTSWSRCRRRSCTRATCRAASTPTTGKRSARSPRSFQIYQDREAFAAEPRRQDPEDLHAVPGRQRAGEGRALRVDGIVGGRLLQLGARRAHEHRRAREHERRDADRQDSRLGIPPRPSIARHASHRRRRAGRERDGLGHARLLRRRRRAGAHSGARPGDSARPISSATSTSARRPRHPAASRCITSSASRPRRRRSRRRSARKRRSRRSPTARRSAAGPTSAQRERAATRTSTT